MHISEFLSSAFHWWWAVSRASTLRTRRPLHRHRLLRDLRSARPHARDRRPRRRAACSPLRPHARPAGGLTKTYNRVHDPDEQADDIVRLREIHVALDYAVRDAYGWDDLDLGHDFHDTKFGTRYTFAPVPRQEVLDRLLELNHERYAEEVRQGLHAKPKGKGRRKVAPGQRDDARRRVRRCLRRVVRKTSRELRAEVEQLMRDDLIGPLGGPEEELRDPPVDQYLLGLLAPRSGSDADRPASRANGALTLDDDVPMAADRVPTTASPAARSSGTRAPKARRRIARRPPSSSCRRRSG